MGSKASSSHTKDIKEFFGKRKVERGHCQGGAKEVKGNIAILLSGVYSIPRMKKRSFRLSQVPDLELFISCEFFF